MTLDRQPSRTSGPFVLDSSVYDQAANIILEEFKKFVELEFKNRDDLDRSFNIVAERLGQLGIAVHVDSIKEQTFRNFMYNLACMSECEYEPKSTPAKIVLASWSGLAASDLQIEKLLRRIDALQDMIVDPATHLELPPPEPGITYVEAKSKLTGKPTVVDVLLSIEEWKPYFDEGILYSGHIRGLMPDLYNALSQYSMRQKISLAMLLRKIPGVLTPDKLESMKQGTAKDRARYVAMKQAIAQMQAKRFSQTRKQRTRERAISETEPRNS